MTTDPVASVYQDGSAPSKSGVRSYERQRGRTRMQSVTEVRNNDLSALLGIEIAGVRYDLDTSDTTTADDGETCIVASAGGRWKRISTDGLSAIEYVEIVVTEWTTSCATGDGQAYFHVPAGLDGMNLVEDHAECITAGVTGTMDVQIRNVTQAVDMLSTKLTIDSGETGSDTAATPAVIDTANDDVAENDLLAIDVDAVHSGTAAKGLLVTLGFQAPSA